MSRLQPARGAEVDFEKRREYPLSDAAIKALRDMCEGDTITERGWWYARALFPFSGPLSETERGLSARLLRMHTDMMGANLRWYHGGVPGLDTGAEILPSGITGAAKKAHQGMPDEVYFTTNYEQARRYALMYPGGGQVYDVKPIGQIEIDREKLRQLLCLMGDRKFPIKGIDLVRVANAFCAPKAEVLGVRSTILRPVG